MADLTSGSSTWATGTQDTASTLVAGVDEKRAAHINGPNAAIVGMQTKLGSATSLIGTKSTLAERLAVGIQDSGVLTSAEPGDLMLSARTSKTGWLLCDGSAVSRATYADLFTAISTTYGAGDGSTTFNVPDYRGRIPIGAGTGVGDGSSGSGAPSGTAMSAVTRGSWAGATRVLLSANESGIQGHTHGFTDPGHAHTAGVDIEVASGTGQHVRSIDAANTSTSSNSTGISLNSNAAAALASHENMPPVMGCNVFIKT